MDWDEEDGRALGTLSQLTKIFKRSSPSPPARVPSQGMETQHPEQVTSHDHDHSTSPVQYDHLATVILDTQLENPVESSSPLRKQTPPAEIYAVPVPTSPPRTPAKPPNPNRQRRVQDFNAHMERLRSEPRVVSAPFVYSAPVVDREQQRRALEQRNADKRERLRLQREESVRLSRSIAFDLLDLGKLRL